MVVRVAGACLRLLQRGLFTTSPSDFTASYNVKVDKGFSRGSCSPFAYFIVMIFSVFKVYFTLQVQSAEPLLK